MAKDYCLSRSETVEKMVKLLPKVGGQDFRSFSYYITDGPSQSTLLDSLKPYIGKQRILCKFRYFEVGESRISAHEVEKRIKSEEEILSLDVRITGMILLYQSEYIEGQWMFTALITNATGDLKGKIIMGGFNPHFRHGGFEILS